MNNNSIILGHQARFRCFLKKYITDAFNDKVHRFQNGCIIQYKIDNQYITIDLIHNGEIDEQKPSYVYYVKPGTTQQSFEKLYNKSDNQSKAKNPTWKYQVITFNKIKIPNDMFTVGNNKYTFYLIRHGQAEHNLNKSLTKTKNQLFGKPDTNLTKQGNQQAFNSGLSAQKYIKNVNFLFVSDLKRTRQTLVSFINGLKINNNSLQIPNKIVILPCLHELSFVQGNPCDGHQITNPKENQIACTYNTCDQEIKSSLKDYDLDWSLYYKFYNEGTRKKKGPFAEHCSNTNFLVQAYLYISYSNASTNVGGKKRKTIKKTFKKKTNKNKNKKHRKTRKVKKYHKY